MGMRMGGKSSGQGGGHEDPGKRAKRKHDERAKNRSSKPDAKPTRGWNPSMLRDQIERARRKGAKITAEKEAAAAAPQQRLDSLLAQGRERGQEMFGGGQDLNAMTAQRLQMLQQQANQGIGAPHLAALRNNALMGMQQQSAQNMANLQRQQGASGIRGAAAQAGALASQAQAGQARQGLENQLSQTDLALRQSSLQGLGQAVNRERLGQLSAEFGTAQLGQAMDATQAQRDIAMRQEEMARLRAASLPGVPSGGGGVNGNGFIGGLLTMPGQTLQGVGQGIGAAASGVGGAVGGMFG